METMRRATNTREDETEGQMPLSTAPVVTPSTAHAGAPDNGAALNMHACDSCYGLPSHSCAETPLVVHAEGSAGVVTARRQSAAPPSRVTSAVLSATLSAPTAWTVPSAVAASPAPAS